MLLLVLVSPLEKNLVEFRLLYSGELLPCGNSNRRTKEKHRIRQALHPQLRRLWTVKPNLRELAAAQWSKQYLRLTTVPPIPVGIPYLDREQEHFEAGLKVMPIFRTFPRSDEGIFLTHHDGALERMPPFTGAISVKMEGRTSRAFR